MKAFLEHLADEIHARAGDDPQKLCIVLPNRRAGLFLKHYLSKRYGRTIWAPDIYSIEDFFVELSGHQLIDQAGLIFELYQVHLELVPENPQDFEQFAGWGQVLLTDFNELDLYLADPNKVFRDVSDTRALNVWNLGERPLTAFEKNYIRFYQSLLDYYLKLKERLLSQGVVYKGLAHRMVAENIEEKASSFTWSAVLFAGLNALSKSEEQVLRYLLEKNKAEIYWDADHYYLDDSFQEAGQFIREYMKHFGQGDIKWIGEHFKGKKEISITGVPGFTGQAIYAGHLLKEMGPDIEKELHKTAIVLADEKLLLPMLNALPGEIDKFNITMGYSLKLTPVYHFFHTLFRMHLGSERIHARKSSAEALFYVRDILNVLASPYLGMADIQARHAIERLIKKLRSSGRVIYTSGAILEHLGEVDEKSSGVFSRVFSSWKDPGLALSEIQGLLDNFKDILTEKPSRDVLEMEYFYHFARIIRRVKELVERFNFIDTLKSLEKVMFELLGNYSLPFYGEPLDGLQLMGVLETRAIDFENLIVLSVNEGVLPAGRMQQSFIPYDIKKDYDLPTHREKDAIFAYHFYRLLQRARRIHLVYETEGTQLGGGEKSRFITQLAYELPRYNEAISIQEQVLSLPPLAGGRLQGISFSKTSTVRQKMVDKAARGYSPSALNTFIQCSLKFFLQEIAGLSEAEEVEDTIDARTLGNVIHHALHQLFFPLKGKALEEDDLEALVKEADRAVEDAYVAKYADGDIDRGKNLLIFEVSRLMVKQYLQQQKKQLGEAARDGEKVSILYLEEFMDTSEPVEFDGAMLEVKIKGKTDRIDLVGDRVRVIDYKTGTINPYELKIKDWEELISNPKHGKAFQLLLYAYIFFKSKKPTENIIESGNISLKTPSMGFIDVVLPDGMPLDKGSMEVFEGYLQELLQRIHDPETAFTQTDDPDQCRYCPFKAFCSR